MSLNPLLRQQMAIRTLTWRHDLGSGVKIKRKRTMAFPQPGACASGGNRRPARSFSTPRPGQGFIEGGHQLEKLEFALAVAMTRGDQSRIDVLREQIDALGGNVEEPGT